jgi:hypothetical protein
MKDAQDKGGGQARTASSDSRHERLKLALRENLKRRKSQARGRSDRASSSSGQDDSRSDDADEERGR